MMMIRYFAALAVLAAVSVPQFATAQFATDSTAGTIMDADNVDAREGVIILTGQADIKQGDVRLLADRVEIYTAGNSGSGIVSAEGITRVVATGNFYYITPDQEVRGEMGVYTAENDRFVVTDNVILLQDDSVVTGSRLDYNLETRDAKVTGTCTGRACPKTERVSILIRSTGETQATQMGAN